MSAEAGDKIIDTRELQERIEELTKRRECEEAQGPNDNDACDVCGALYLDEEERAELEALLELRDENGLSEWYDGATLILEDHFEEYAREFAEDIGAIPDDAGWPATCIDWERAANELRMDYSSVEFGGYTYHVRS